MMLWPTVALIAFMVLTVLVIALGTSSTNRYEREQRAKAGQAPPARTEPGGAVRAA